MIKRLALITLFGMTLLSCDPLTGMRRKILLAERPSTSCEQMAAQRIGNLDEFRYLGQSRTEPPYHCFGFKRAKTFVQLCVHTSPNPEWDLSFSWIGFRDVPRETENLRLVQEVQEALIRACGLSEKQLRIVDECIRMECPK